MLKSQKSTLAEILIRYGLKTSDFCWERAISYYMGDNINPVYVDKLKHISSDYYFVFDYTSDGERLSIYSPGEEKIYDSKQSGNWENQATHFRWWVSYLRREFDAPDLWGEVLESLGFEKAVDNSEEMFSEEEKKEVTQRIEDTKVKLLEEYTIEDTQLKSINEKLDYLIQAVEKQSKFNWWHLARSICLDIAMTIGKNSPEGKKIFEFLSTIASNVFNAAGESMKLILKS